MVTHRTIWEFSNIPKKIPSGRWMWLILKCYALPGASHGWPMIGRSLDEVLTGNHFLIFFCLWTIFLFFFKFRRLIDHTILVSDEHLEICACKNHGDSSRFWMVNFVNSNSSWWFFDQKSTPHWHQCQFMSNILQIPIQKTELDSAWPPFATQELFRWTLTLECNTRSHQAGSRSRS